MGGTLELFSNLTFTSLPFLLFFLPAVYVGYRILIGTPFVNYWLCAASLFFYGSNGIWYLVPLLFTCVFDYIVGQMIDPARHFYYRRVLFIISVAIQIGLLSFFKYCGWLTADWNTFAHGVGFGVFLPVSVFFLPPGISFYTFHTISYTADMSSSRSGPICA